MTVATIAAALESVLDDVAGIDQTSIDTYIPAISTQGTAMLITPFGQSAVIQFNNLAGNSARIIHRIPIEFWTKVSTGTLAATIAAARDIGRTAVLALMANDGTDYEIWTAEDVTISVTDAPVVVGDIAYIVTTITLPVWEDVSV